MGDLSCRRVRPGAAAIAVSAHGKRSDEVGRFVQPAHVHRGETHHPRFDEPLQHDEAGPVEELDAWGAIRPWFALNTGS